MDVLIDEIIAAGLYAPANSPSEELLTLARAARERRVRNAATAIISGEVAITTWLNTPTAALSGKRPVDLLDTSEGTKAVLDLLAKQSAGNAP